MVPGVKSYPQNHGRTKVVSAQLSVQHARVAVAKERADAGIDICHGNQGNCSKTKVGKSANCIRISVKLKMVLNFKLDAVVDVCVRQTCATPVSASHLIHEDYHVHFRLIHVGMEKRHNQCVQMTTDAQSEQRGQYSGQPRVYL